MPAFYIMYDARGPYTNVLDLYLFPSMSHRHSALLQLYNNTEANKEQTWKTIETVWKDTSSSEVAREFVLAYRIMRLIIEEDGNNLPRAELVSNVLSRFVVHPKVCILQGPR